MIRILFLCHGNICRSPMAEFIMKDLVKKAGLEQSIQIESAATSTEEIGNPVYPPTRRKLSEHGIDCSGKRARQLLNSDYEKYDLLIGMDRANLRSMYRICGGDFADKMHLLMDFTDPPRRGSRSVVHRRFRHDLAGCGGRLPGIATKNNQQGGADKWTSWLSTIRNLFSVQWNSERDDFISLTDIAKLKDSDNPRYIIQNWLRNRNTIEFLGVWESLYNPSFNRVEFDAFRSQAGLNSFVMTPQKWVSRPGLSASSPKLAAMAEPTLTRRLPSSLPRGLVEFKLYLVKEFERLKTEE